LILGIEQSHNFSFKSQVSILTEQMELQSLFGRQCIVSATQDEGLHDSDVEDEDSTLNDSWTENTESTVEDDVIHAGKEVDLDAVSEHRVNGVGHLEDGELEAGPRAIFQDEGESGGWLESR